MAFETLDEWKAYASAEILEVIKQGIPPGTWNECRHTKWENVLSFFCESTYSLENLDFLWAVSEYHGHPGVDRAEDIIENIVYGSQPLNLYPETSAPIDEWYQDEDHELRVDLFDPAEREVVDRFSGTYAHFRSAVNTARQGLLREEGRAGA